MKKPNKRMSPQRVKLGWNFLWGAVACWVVSLLTSSIALRGIWSSSLFPYTLRMRVTLVLAVAQLVAAIAALVVLSPTGRRRRMRNWSVILLAVVIILTSLYHFLTAIRAP